MLMRSSIVDMIKSSKASVIENENLLVKQREAKVGGSRNRRDYGILQLDLTPCSKSLFAKTMIINLMAQHIDEKRGGTQGLADPTDAQIVAFADDDRE